VIDPRAIIDPAARLGRNVAVGPWSIVGPEVEIGDDCEIGPHVILKGPSIFGARNRIYPFAVLGEDTPAFAYRGERTRLVVGEDNIFREGVTVHRGMGQGQGETTIGSRNLLMAYVHVAHDCVVGNSCIFANNASLSGHVRVADHANFGGYSGVPQYRSVGAYAMVGGMSLVLKDVPAFVSVSGNPARAIGMNTEGMRRHGFSPQSVRTLRSAYRTLYRQGLRADEALRRLEADAAREPALEMLCRSVRGARFGIVRPRWDDRFEPEPGGGDLEEGDPFGVVASRAARDGG